MRVYSQGRANEIDGNSCLLKGVDHNASGGQVRNFDLGFSSANSLLGDIGSSMSDVVDKRL